VSRALDELRLAELEEEMPDDVRDSIAQAELGSLREELNSLLGDGEVTEDSGVIRQLSGRLAAALHTELGITLLTYCYAYHGAPEIDALAFDPNFIRKHDFYGDIRRSHPGWSPTTLNQRDRVGSYFAGSISGLGYQLSRLESARSFLNLKKHEGKELRPTLLAGMRHIQRSLLSDRAQEYVALSVRLARQVLSRAVDDDRVNLWCDGTLARLTSPRKREQVAIHIRDADPFKAARILSPSELFFLGEALFKDMGLSDSDAASKFVASSHGSSGRDLPRWLRETDLDSRERHERQGSSGGQEDLAPNMASPLVDRIREIVPAPGSAEAARFRSEINQYGIFLRRRMGLNRNSLLLSDPYQQLARIAHPDLLFERICDLKIRIAEINYSLGLPAYLSGLEGEMALRDISSPPEEAGPDGWEEVLSRIARLDAGNAREWIEQLIGLGLLTVSTDNTRDR
jgi:hypothetical protein